MTDDIEILEVPFGESVTIDASDAEPRWIKAPAEDLHIRVGGHTDTPLFAGHEPMLITQTTLVREPNGRPSQIIVTVRRPQGARAHREV